MQEFLTPERRTEIKNIIIPDLENQRRINSKRIAEAQEQGDLGENAEFAAAKEAQSLIESEMNRLTELIRTAEIIDNDKNSGIVEVGSKVTIKIKFGIQTFIIIGKEETDPSKGKISHESPLGQALLNKKIKDEGKYTTPGGDMTFEIIGIA